MVDTRPCQSRESAETRQQRAQAVPGEREAQGGVARHEREARGGGEEAAGAQAAGRARDEGRRRDDGDEHFMTRIAFVESADRRHTLAYSFKLANCNIVTLLYGTLGITNVQDYNAPSD